jgi:4-hydroxy-tetrahydrodipicolinate synthase
MKAMTNQETFAGVWPVMLTPFDHRREIDWTSLERLIDWYIAAGVHGLFAACQSSEIFFLSDAENAALTRFVVDKVDGRVPVVASGHTANAPSQQRDQLSAIAATGVDGVILISNRLAMAEDPDEVVLANLAELTDALPKEVPLGVYECPHPYKRLLSDAAVRWCAASGRYRFIKDTCCDIVRLTRRLSLVAGSPLHIANANSQTLLASLKAGAHGFSGVMANFHPDLYVWLYENWRAQPDKALRLSQFLSVAALCETLSYPVCAKDFQVGIGTFTTALCRSRGAGAYFDSHERSTITQMTELEHQIRDHLALA